MSEKTCCCLNLKQAAIVSSSWSLVRSFQLLDIFFLSLFQLYSLVQLVSIIYQEASEGIILQTSPTTNQTTTIPSYGSVLQPSGMERDELRVYHSLLAVVFVIVIFTCFLLFIGIYKVCIVTARIIILCMCFFKTIAHLFIPWFISTSISIISETSIYIYLIFNQKVGI